MTSTYDNDSRLRRPSPMRRPRSMHIQDGSVRSPNHANIFRKCLYDMFLSSNYCDVTLVTNTTTFKAHKVVLAANSAYFHAMFSSTCLEALQSVVSFKDNPYVTSTGLSAILQYAYTGSLPISHSSVREILEVARHLLMRDVTLSCEGFMLDITINLDNYVGLFETAREFGLTRVEKRIERFFECNEVNLDNYLEKIDFVTVTNSYAVLEKVITFISQELHNLMFSKEFLDIMEPKILLAMVKANRHGFFTDMTLINFIVKWVETSPEDRLPVLSDVIKKINLLCFEVDALDKIANLPFFKEDEKVKEHISEAKSCLLEVKERSAEDDLYAVNAYGGALKFHSLANESVITKKAVLGNIQSRIHHRQVSISFDHSVIAVGDILFFIGEPINLANGGKGCPCFSYDPARNVWKEHAGLPSDRHQFRLVSSEGEVFAIGGSDNNSARYRVDVYIYDFTRDEWRTETPLPRSFSSLTAAAFNGSIYVFGHGYKSYGGASSISAFLKYDRDKNEWAEKSPPKMFASLYGGFRVGHLVACSKGLYQITCVREQLYQNKDVPALGVQFYDQASNHWEYSTVYHAFGNFDINAVLSHMDDMYIIASYTKKIGDGLYEQTMSMCSVFRFTEAAREIELVKDEFPRDDERNVALVSIPKASIARLAKRAERRAHCAFSKPLTL